MTRRPPGGCDTAVMQLPDPAVVLLVGASGSGKSTWAAARYREVEVVASDALRAVVGSGTGDLEASEDAFRLLDQILEGRCRRGLTVVLDTLGLDPVRRAHWAAVARAAGLPTVAVVFDTPGRCAGPATRVGTARSRPRCSTVSCGGCETSALSSSARAGTPGSVTTDEPTPAPSPAQPDPSDAADGPRVMLQIGRFPWGEEPLDWLRQVARAADEAGFAGLALMDHLIQIPQVGRAWEPIPEPWVTLGALAALGTDLALGTLCTPATFRAPGIVAKAAATLDVLSGGRAFCGLGAGWWGREHAAYGLRLPRHHPSARRARDRRRDHACAVGARAPGPTTATGCRCRRPRATHGLSGGCR